MMGFVTPAKSVVHSPDGTVIQKLNDDLRAPSITLGANANFFQERNGGERGSSFNSVCFGIVFCNSSLR
jgi:hypothetical protein